MPGCMTGNDMIEIKEIQKSYGKKCVLRNVSLQVERGSCVGILGGNGCGKSTLLSILAGVLPADSGSFLREGTDLLCDEKTRQRVLGYVPQGNPLMEELTAWDNLRLWYGKKELERELSDGILKMLDIGEFIRVPVKKMSGGMKKRVSIGCAVAAHPEILLLDEPSAALDLACKEKIGAYLKSFQREGGSILLATHDVQELALCDCFYILRDGVLAEYHFDGDVHRLAQELQGVI